MDFNKQWQYQYNIGYLNAAASPGVWQHSDVSQANYRPLPGVHWTNARSSGGILPRALPNPRVAQPNSILPQVRIALNMA